MAKYQVGSFIVWNYIQITDQQRVWGFVTEIGAFIEFERKVKVSLVVHGATEKLREGICLEHVAYTKPTEIISRRNLPKKQVL